MSRIEISKVNKYYGDVHVLKDLDLVVEDGDFMTLLGPSGCGKTTTLRVIAGLEAPQRGTLSIGGVKAADGEVNFNMPPAKRGVNLVFQSYALWPHMTVFENVAFGLVIKKMAKAKITEKVTGALGRLHIQEFAERYPSELSGGQQQRVAIARSIVSEPRVLLLDEPLSNLDAKLRIEMRSELKRLHQELKTTVVYVTHDQVEALTMSTKIAVFFEGRLVQVDTPKGLYGNPVELRVADFIGNPKINFVECCCSTDGDALVTDSVLGRMVLDRAAARNARFPPMGVEPVACGVSSVLAIRPEHVHIGRVRTPGAVPCRIYSALPAGSETLIQAAVNGDMIMAKVIGQEEFGQDESAWLSVQTDKLNVYDKASGRIALGALS
ncbi:MAG TPA: ABC transporter ATP-binding protein [Treponema sp.]|nr:MAG: ABC transporter [Treponema sp. GWA1_62_8]OHE62720.1 MAG: ABC transporter [Treponema sp. GWC1_61_84]OHE75129.1 MAG: ABC transporter [Treponema sp. RIFOXYC1_FULL_61_9]HCM26063.1 ABC transporter ATP-binding protein [Treponema sp.]